MCFKRGRM
jgi:hypothetical protein